MTPTATALAPVAEEAVTSATLAQLTSLRARSGPRQTAGLDDVVIARFVAADSALRRALAEAADERERLEPELGDRIRGDEAALVSWLQADYVNFYDAWAVNPYVPLAARGPWIVTTHGAVIHDSGGYGMLGFGHAPDAVIDAIAKPWVVANIMTASASQRRLADALRAEIGHNRPDRWCFDRFVCMNSGSESVTVALRISDIRAARVTAEGGRYAGRKVKFLALEGGFHGRTDRPAQASGSTAAKYEAHLASFRSRDNLVRVPPNDVHALRAAFEAADRDGVYFEMMLVEPVMGEGNPGMAMSRAFYDEARRLTQQMGTFLLVDSIQAGLRTTGALSLVDYPGFEDCDPPDMETWSKALNAAQYPLSVLGLNAEAAATYVRGVYGNTMTANPRALEAGCATLQAITPALRANIRARGAEWIARLEALAAELPGVIMKVQGTGLLVSAELDATRFQVNGDDGIEARMRRAGIGVIHGGKNALRFTPPFQITSAEIELVIDVMRRVLVEASAEA